MINRLRQLFRAPGAPDPVAEPSPPAAAVPPGTRVYAVGDVHGRLDLFSALVDAIEADDAMAVARDGPVQTTVVLLGDLIDRGPDSAGVLGLAREWRNHRRVRILCGNHEEMLLHSFDKIEVLRQFLYHGGRETVLSFGIDEASYSAATFEEVQAMMNEAVPQAARDFIASFEDVVQIGDYAFVHAGVRPGVPLGEQRRSDLRWIRENFLSSTARHEAVIVHGHTITDGVELRPNRIGIDTGAYLSGVLSALCLEGGSRRLIEARAGEGGVTIHHSPL